MLNIARLGLNDGAQLWISFKFFSKQTFFIMHIRDLHNKGFVSFEKLPTKNGVVSKSCASFYLCSITKTNFLPKLELSQNLVQAFTCVA